MCLQARGREKDGGSGKAEAAPALPSTQGRRPLTLSHWGWAGCGAEGLGVPPSAQLRRPRPSSQSSGAGAAAGRGLQGSGVSAGRTRAPR